MQEEKVINQSSFMKRGEKADTIDLKVEQIKLRRIRKNCLCCNKP